MSKMAESRPSIGKMAVTSDNHEIKENMSKEELEQKFVVNNIRPGIDVVPKKKTFKITSVKLNDTNDGDSMDDLDESHTEMTEDYSSEILDTSRATDYEQETPSAAEDIPLTNQSMRQVGDGKDKQGADMHSRFRVVKIETKEPFHRGRWICLDFLDPQPPVTSERSDTRINDEANSGSSSAGSSIHYVPGLDDPAKNPLLAGATGTIYYAAMPPDGQSLGNQDLFQPIHPATSSATTQPNMSSNPQSQVSSLGYFTDTSQGQGTNHAMCQTLNQSQSHQSISTAASVDNVQHTSGQPKKGEGHSAPPTSQIIGTHTQNDNSNMGNIPQPNVYLPHYSSGPTGQSMYPPNIQATSHMSNVVTSAGMPATSIPNQDQTANTYQTYVHLGKQIANPGLEISGQNEPVSNEVVTEANADVPQTVSERPDTLPGASELSPTKDLTEELDKDLNVIQNQNALSPALVAAVGDLQSPQEEDQGGSSTVAIDNKIEQAMDLVKSHLMFAVREEVEVLREQIAELIERNNQLEYENGILRAAASPETLAKLSQPRQQPPPSSSS